jgi:hypothetical protein
MTPSRARGLVRRTKWVFIATRRLGIVEVSKQVALKVLKRQGRVPVRVSIVDDPPSVAIWAD